MNPPRARRATRPTGPALVAYHEAGHAVAAIALGCPCEGVTIVRSHNSTGMAHMRLMYLEDFQRGVVCVAGAMSELLAHKLPLARPALTEASLGAVDDFLELGKLNVDADAVMDQCAKILQEAWPLVEAVAKRLLEVGTLDGNQVSEIAESFNTGERL